MREAVLNERVARLGEFPLTRNDLPGTLLRASPAGRFVRSLGVFSWPLFESPDQESAGENPDVRVVWEPGSGGGFAGPRVLRHLSEEPCP